MPGPPYTDYWHASGTVGYILPKGSLVEIVRFTPDNMEWNDQDVATKIDDRSGFFFAYLFREDIYQAHGIAKTIIYGRTETGFFGRGKGHLPRSIEL